MCSRRSIYDTSPFIIRTVTSRNGRVVNPNVQPPELSFPVRRAYLRFLGILFIFSHVRCLNILNFGYWFHFWDIKKIWRTLTVDLFQYIQCDAIRSEYFLILCRLISLLTLVVCLRMVLRISFENNTSSAIAIKYPYLDEIYFVLISLNFIFIFKTTIPLN